MNLLKRIAQAINPDEYFPDSYDYWTELVPLEKHYLQWLGPDNEARVWKYRNSPFYLVDEGIVDFYLTIDGKYPYRWDLFDTTDVGEAKAKAGRIVQQLQTQAPEHYRR